MKENVLGHVRDQNPLQSLKVLWLPVILLGVYLWSLGLCGSGSWAVRVGKRPVACHSLDADLSVIVSSRTFTHAHTHSTHSDILPCMDILTPYTPIDWHMLTCTTHMHTHICTPTHSHTCTLIPHTLTHMPRLTRGHTLSCVHSHTHPCTHTRSDTYKVTHTCSHPDTLRHTHGHI